MNHVKKRLGFLPLPNSYAFYQLGPADIDLWTPKVSNLSRVKNGFQLKFLIKPNYHPSDNRFFWMMMEKFLDWWRLIISPTKNNELPSIELSWAWKPTYRERACRNYIGKRSLCLFFSWNSDRWSKARLSSTQHGFWPSMSGTKRRKRRGVSCLLEINN